MRLLLLPATFAYVTATTYRTDGMKHLIRAAALAATNGPVNDLMVKRLRNDRLADLDAANANGYVPAQ